MSRPLVRIKKGIIWPYDRPVYRKPEDGRIRRIKDYKSHTHFNLEIQGEILLYYCESFDIVDENSLTKLEKVIYNLTNNQGETL